MDIIYVIGGLIGLIVGGEYLVRGAVAIANRYHISPMIIGLTLVGFGTSTPELVTPFDHRDRGSGHANRGIVTKLPTRRVSPDCGDGVAICRGVLWRN